MKIRRHMRFLSFLTLSMALLFGIRELPELLSLADDVSNDGVATELVASGVSSDRSSELDYGESAPRAVSKVVPRFWTCHFPRTLPLRAGKSLLQLLSLRRT